MIVYKNSLIYCDNLNQNRLNSKIVDIITNEFKHPIIDGQYCLELNCACADDEIPTISLMLSPK